MRGYFSLWRKMKNQKLWIDRNAPQISNTECV